MSKKFNKSKSEYINELPENVFEIKYYDNMFNSQFNRYWFDVDNNKIIMRDKRNNKFKIVHPMKDKYHQDDNFAHLIDINGNKTFINYDWFIFSHSIGFYLQPESFDYVCKLSKEVFE